SGLDRNGRRRCERERGVLRDRVARQRPEAGSRSAAQCRDAGYGDRCPRQDRRLAVGGKGMGERLSALARALRTFAQGLGAAVLVAGWEAAYTAVRSEERRVGKER